MLKGIFCCFQCNFTYNKQDTIWTKVNEQLTHRKIVYFIIYAYLKQYFACDGPLTNNNNTNNNRILIQIPTDSNVICYTVT